MMRETLRSVRTRVGALTVVAAGLGITACVAPAPVAPPATTTTTTSTTTTTTIPTYSVPATSLSAPSFSAAIPSVSVSYLGCGGTYNPPAITLSGPSVSIPATTLRGAGVVALPGVSATLAAASVNVSTFRVSCLGLSYSTGVVLEYNAATAAPSATVNLDNGQVSVGSTTLTISGRLRFPGFGGLTVGLPSFNVTVPGFSATVPLG